MSLSLLGGSPRFPQGLAFSRPALPRLQDIQAQVEGMLQSGMVTKGQHLKAYEEALHRYTGAPHCVAVSSCTTGLVLAMQALGARGAIALPSFSFCASFTAPVWNGLQLCFVDCEPDTFTISLSHLRQVLARGDVSVVLATYIYGNPPDIDGLEAVCREAGARLVFDAAHAFGSLYHGARPGGRGDAEVFSTSATKLLATGEGGVVATRHAPVAEHVEVGREYGNPGNYDCMFAGLNARLSEFHAVLGQWSLAHLEETATRRNVLSTRLEAGLKDVPGLTFQIIRDGCRSSYKDWGVLVGEAFGVSRDQLATILKSEGIPTRAYFDPPGHRQTAFRQAVELPVTERISRQVLCLPMHTHLSEADVDGMIEVMHAVHAAAPRLQTAGVQALHSGDRLKLILIDTLLVLGGIYGAIFARFENLQLNAKWFDTPRTITYFVMTAVILALYAQADLYKRLPRYSGIEEALLIIRRTTIGCALFMMVAFATGGLWLSRSIVILSWIFITMLVGGLRFVLRLASERKSATGGRLRRVVIVGADDSGEATARDIVRRGGYDVLGFFDADPAKKGTFIHGTPVLGTPEQLPALVATGTVDEVVVTEHRPALMRELVARCDLSKTSLRTIPSATSVMDGRISVHFTRQVRIDDLLEREPVKTELGPLKSEVQGRVVLVTGAGGSIGGEICRQLAQLEPERLILVGRGENSIYEIALELKEAPFVPVIADVRDQRRMQTIFERYKPALVFHAAAHKHVPMMETNVSEAVSVNILGTRVLLDLAHQTGVERLVLLSTDKAVVPSSIMGASKRMAEMLLRHRSRDSKTRYAAVRFGNVLGSRGSVVPTFRRQIEQGGPVTITHPDMTRYFMTIPEAVQLVLQAAILAQGGDIYILDMGQPVRIVDLARNLIRLSGFEPERDIPIQFQNPRPGEKMTEELVNPNEKTVPTAVEKILLVQTDADLPPVDEWLPQLQDAVTRQDDTWLRQHLLDWTRV